MKKWTIANMACGNVDLRRWILATCTTSPLWTAFCPIGRNGANVMCRVEPYFGADSTCFFFSYVSMFNLFKLQLTPSSVRCGAGQQVKRRQVVQCPSNGPTEAETAWKSHLTVFGFHHPSLALHVEIIATEVSKQRWLWLYFCLVGASCGKPCDKYGQVTQKMWRTDFYDNCTEVAYTCMQYTGRTAGQHVSSPCLRSLWLCQNDKWSDCPPAPWSRWSFWNCEMWGLREWMRSCWLCLDSSALSRDSHVKVLKIAMGLRSGATMALATSLSAERVFLTEFRLLQIFWTFWIFELGRKKTSLKRS